VSARRLVVLGATGTVGRSTLDVAARHPGRLRVHALTAHRDAAALFALCQQHRPAVAVLVDPAAARELRERLKAAGLSVDVREGEAALAEIAADAELVMSAIVGAAGLKPTLAAVRAGRRVLIANKEPLVMAGRLLLAEAAAASATLIPIDSEHNAIFQCLPQGFRCGSAESATLGVRKLVLTASGGPFRELPLAELERVTPAQAVRHPNWVMGPKISVDSATMMNKGLELIEAQLLFGVPEAQIEVVLHPESVIHSLVEYADGSTLAHLVHARAPRAAGHARADRARAGVPRALGLRRARPEARRAGTPEFPGRRPAALPVPGPRARRFARRGHPSECAERRQRSGRRGVPGRTPCVHAHPRRHRGHAGRRRRRPPGARRVARSGAGRRRLGARCGGESPGGAGGGPCLKSPGASPRSSSRSACWCRSTSSAISGSRAGSA
jgi:1-deoxy-D-xylulose-5-phosphate reductoisomerase